MKQSVKLAKKYKTPIVIVSGAKNKWELRGTGELIAFGEELGLQRNEAKAALFCFQDKLWKRQELKKSGQYIMPGVELVEKAL
jgi:RNase P/RNase MRP subunit p30